MPTIGLGLKNINPEEAALLIKEISKEENNKEVILEELHLIDDLLRLTKLKDIFNQKKFASNKKARKQKFSDIVGDRVLLHVKKIEEIKKL